MDKGAHFYRCDFQVHTPRDRNWSGTHYVSEKDRADYAARFIEACRAKQLDAVAITDHHDLTFVEYIREAARSETDLAGQPLPEHEKIVVFPGIELTLSVPCQAILIFDADVPSDLFSLILNALAITPSPATEPMTREVVRLDEVTTLEKLREDLNRHTYLKNHYIILPNVSDGGGDTLLRKGGMAKYKSMPCVGGYLDGGIERIGYGVKDIIEGKSKEWGNKRIAVFQTSDSRTESHEKLGSACTWIKWAVPTAEALRQACLAQESRVCQVSPTIPSVAINSLSISNSKFLGPFDLEFNQQYNAIIGGRGTGKSTILEYLRWALCDQPPSIADGEDVPNYLSRRQRLIDETLKPIGATVEVKFEVNGVQHMVRRESLNGSTQLKIARDDLTECTEDEVRSLLPIQAYSQKQLSNVSVRMDELLRFVTTPIRSKLSFIDEQLALVENRIRETHAVVTRKRTLTRTIEERRLAEVSLAEQAESLREGLTGLSEADRSLLENQSLYASNDRTVNAWRDAVGAFKNGAEELQTLVENRMATLRSPPEELEPDTMRAAYDECRNLLAVAKSDLGELIARADAITTEPERMQEDSPWRTWSESRAKYQESYNAALKRSSAHQHRMDQLKEIDERLQLHLVETGRVREQLNLLENAEETYEAERREWYRLVEERDNELEEQCEKLTADSGGTIRASVNRFADTSGFAETLRASVAGSRIPATKFENLAKKISNEGDSRAANEMWRKILSDLANLAEYDFERDGEGERPAAPMLSECGFTGANLDAVGRLFAPSDWLSLSLIPIEGEPLFEYQAKEQEYIPFRNASSGQQATALLKTLLNQPGSPLIIDQPEEDLDNPVILDIVKLVWDSKQKRQLVFASHNANLVVNGDAELVVWCDNRTAGDQSGGRIAGEGAIDVDDVRDAIKRIMEGGEQAFNLRKAKYGF